MCTAQTQMCAHVTDPISICRKRVGLSRWCGDKNNPYARLVERKKKSTKIKHHKHVSQNMEWMHIIQMNTDILYCFIFCTLCHDENFVPWKIQVAFPTESQLQQSHATQPWLNVKCMLGLFCVFIIHQTTGSLMCVRDHSYTYIGVGQWVSTFLTWGKKKVSQSFPAVLMGVQKLGSLDLQSDALTNWATPVTPGQVDIDINTVLLYMGWLNC